MEIIVFQCNNLSNALHKDVYVTYYIVCKKIITNNK